MEKWKKIKHVNNYEVSNMGNVRNREGIPIRGGVVCGYRQVGLYQNGLRKYFLIHRLVASTFLGNTNNKPCVNHIDGNKRNNDVNNLEWCTHSENSLHSFKVGLQSHKGERHNRSKLTERDVVEIRGLINSGRRFASIAEEYRVSVSAIMDIKFRRSWDY